MTQEPDPSSQDPSLPFDVHLSFSGVKWPGTEDQIKDQTTKVAGITLAHIVPLVLGSAAPSDVSLELSFLFTDDSHIQDLNRNFRGKDSPTNVLSFPDTAISLGNLEDARRFGDPLLVGDVALALQTITREADEQKKSFSHHLTHLIVHGILHLAGYDHLDDEEAEEMESLEIEILAKMSIDNPYKTDDS